MIFPHALRLDTSTICYLTFIPLIILLLQSLLIKKWFIHGIYIYNIVLIILYSFIVAGETGLYEEWKTKLTYKALLYLQNPGEVVQSARTAVIAGLTVFVVLYSVLGIFVFKWIMKRNDFENRKPRWQAILCFAVMVPVLVIGARGGLQEIPINQSQSYFSEHDILNLTAVNPAFNLYISVFENRQFASENPFNYFDKSTARAMALEAVKMQSDSSIQFLNIAKPNIVLLLLESWSADLIESLGGEAGISPEFAKLEKEGVLFTHVYAGGARSEQGMAAILSGFPPHPYTSITVQPDKYVQLPSLVKSLKNNKYHTSFYFGGQLIYGNIKSYIMFNGFDRVKEVYDFKPGLPKGKLGIHDEYTLTEQLEDLNSERQPFFSMLFTLSSHSPYDQPMQEVLTWGGNERRYINSAYYTDRCLGNFFESAKQQAWYDSTVFILIADHSHNSYRNWHPNSFEYHRIPLLICGNALKPEFKGKKIDFEMSQTDLVATLLRQLKMDHSEFIWSRNVMNPDYNPFAYFMYDYGIGWKVPQGQFIWDHQYQYTREMSLPEDIRIKTENTTKAFLQTVFQDYIDY